VLAIAIENLARAIAPVLCHMAEDIWQHLPYRTPTRSVFESGWVKLKDAWQQPELAEKWNVLRQLRAETNKVLERARAEKAIGASLDAKVLLYVPDATLKAALAAMNPAAGLNAGDRVDELRYLFLTSQVELLDTPDAARSAQFSSETDLATVGVVSAEGEKCDRCWNYSPTVGHSREHPTICDRCEAALSDKF